MSEINPGFSYDGEDWVNLQRDLDELEATDPAVREAARRYDAMIERLTGRAIQNAERA